MVLNSYFHGFIYFPHQTVDCDLDLWQCARQENRQLPGSRSSWNQSAKERGCGARPTPLWEKELLGTQQRWGKHERRQRRILQK
jgi:hypothetical protein